MRDDDPGPAARPHHPRTSGALERPRRPRFEGNPALADIGGLASWGTHPDEAVVEPLIVVEALLSSPEAGPQAAKGSPINATAIALTRTPAG